VSGVCSMLFKYSGGVSSRLLEALSFIQGKLVFKYSWPLLSAPLKASSFLSQRRGVNVCVPRTKHSKMRSRRARLIKNKHLCC